MIKKLLPAVAMVLTLSACDDDDKTPASSCVVDSLCTSELPYSCNAATYCYETLNGCASSNECPAGTDNTTWKAE